jgi:uncharacterized protein YcbK (DUF882 family)
MNKPARRRVLSIVDRTEVSRRYEGHAWLNWLGAFVAAMIISITSASQAEAQTRSLKLYFIHTKERAEITYMRNGRYDQRGLNEINRFLRDWRRNEPAKMDPRLLDLVWSVYRTVGARDYIHVVSAYRSPATNKMLRSRSSGVAEKSQHMLGKAMDFYIPGVALSKLRAAAFKVEGGGVGYYPKSGSPFVHLDVGNVRSWPRMNRRELMALFPDGRTIHVPADGKPLPGYQQALAAYKQRQRSGASVQIASVDASSGSSRSGKGLLATLFGGGADEEEDVAESSARSAPVAAAPRAAPEPEPVRETPETIIAALPARSVPLPGVAPRPVVDVGAPSNGPLIAGLPERQPADLPFAVVDEEVAINVPLPTSRPDYTPAPSQVAATETQDRDLPVTAIAGNAPRSAGSSAITEMLAMSAADARADVVINAPVPALRPRLSRQDEASRQVASIATPDDGGNIFALASLPSMDEATAVPAKAQIASRDLAEQQRVASLAASPRVAVISRDPGTDVESALRSGVRTTAKAAKPRAGVSSRSEPRSVAVPVQQELTRWAFKRDVTVASAGGSKEPARAHAMVRTAPSTVYTTGFQKQAPAARADRFTGKAVTFMSVARFATN